MCDREAVVTNGRRRLGATAGRIRPAVFADLQSRIDRMTAAGERLIPLQIGDTHRAPPLGAQRALAAIDPADATIHRLNAIKIGSRQLDGGNLAALEGAQVIAGCAVGK